ncbi:MAG: beta-ketoacyl-[acyl-carrier-protein] synthase II, partial [Spirochaetaceae bacterium]|nr:beta-ketoacyl-[acyl-carrier-protein] synthase II [Spirochaetaceae bacterium]
MKKRVVVTGLGTVNALGHSVEKTWQAVKAGECGVGKITAFDAEGFSTKIAAEVKDFDAKAFMEAKEARKMDRFSQFAVSAAVQAMTDAGLAPGGFAPERAGCVLGVGIGGFWTIEESMRLMIEKGPQRIPPMTIPKLIGNIGPGNVSLHFDLRGPCYTVTTACSSGTDALGSAARWIQSGDADFIVSGGAEATITPFCIASFNVIQAMSTRNDEPQKASRPFDKDRDGF